MASERATYLTLTDEAIASCSLEQNIQTTIRAALLSRKGEVPAHPELGSSLYDFLFRPLTLGLTQELEREIRQCLERGEPRIEIQAVDIQPNYKDKCTFAIDLKYRIKSSHGTGRYKFSLTH